MASSAPGRGARRGLKGGFTAEDAESAEGGEGVGSPRRPVAPSAGVGRLLGLLVRDRRAVERRRLSPLYMAFMVKTAFQAATA